MRDHDPDPDATLPLPGRVLELLQKRDEEERREEARESEDERASGACP